jgi:cyclopropane-fatty-acyl-phospholipid synthase
MSETIATALDPLFKFILGPEPRVQVRFWDGSVFGPPGGVAQVSIDSPEALRRILYRPNDLGFGRAYVSGGLRLEGDAYEALRSVARAAPADWKVPPRLVLSTLAAVRRHGILGRPVPPPPEEARLRGRLHSRRRDAEAISHHYDVSNEFYRLFLGPTLTYSCARFVTPETTLDQAQEAKYELICRKLGLQAGQRLLDVGCGWGGMLLHAARHHGVRAVGATISQEQWELARKRAAEAGLEDRVDVRLSDYRELPADEVFDAVCSIGMFEHVGSGNADLYFEGLYRRLVPGGRLLNHAISTPEGSSVGRNTFIARYVFPDGELHDVGDVVLRMEKAGFEVRDVESLREHYALTLRSWVANLESRWDEAVAMVGEGRARVWRIYMIGSAVSFEENEIAVHQVLGVKTPPDGRSGMPMTRTDWA